MFLGQAKLENCYSAYSFGTFRNLFEVHGVLKPITAGLSKCGCSAILWAWLNPGPTNNSIAILSFKPIVAHQGQVGGCNFVVSICVCPATPVRLTAVLFTPMLG